uniref:Alpha-2-macroglobulin domain-containing protein n=1 Tax=Megaselia scalaris TaxID=36166 RepID=T1GEK5_MEGSC
DNEIIERKNIEIAKYVLPKFDVNIDTPSNISIEDKTLKVKVSSNYTYGKPVSGKLTVYVNNFFCEESEKIAIEKEYSFEGIADLNIDIEYPNSFDNPLIIKAVVKEDLTGLTQETMTTVYVRTEKYSISGINIPSTFKPGEESVIKIAIKKYDGTPVLDSKNPVTLNALRSSYTEYQESAEKEILKFEGFLNETGSVEFTFIFPYKDNTITEYYLKAKYDDTESWVGHTYFSFESTSTESINLSVKTRNPSIYKDLLVSLSSSFAGRQSITEMIPTIKWLIAQRNSEGGFDSTQDTVVGLQALTMFAQKSGCGNAEMNVEFKTDEGSNGSFSVSKENSLVLQSHILPKSTKFIE